ILLAGNNVSKATEIVKELNKSHSQSTQVEVLTTTMLLQQGKIDEAYTQLKKAVKNTPDSVPLQLLLAQAAAAKGDTALSEASFRIAAQLDPASLAAQNGLASIASRRGDSSSLAQIAENTIAAHPEYANAYLWRGIAEANGSQFDQAEIDFQTALKKDPNSADAYTQLGQLRLRQQRVAEGNAMLEKALEKDPNAARALNLLITSDLTAKQPAKAIARIQQLIVKSPNSSVLYGDLAGVQLNMKDYAGAKDSASKSMQLNPANEDAVEAFSHAAAGLGQNDQGIAIWERWLQSHPNDSRATLLLGTFEEANGDVAKASEYYKKTLAISPNQPMASNNLAYLEIENGGNPDVALTLAQTARRGMPESPNTADTLAWVYYHAGRYDSARDLLEDAVKSDSDSALIRYHLGMTYTKLKQFSDAKTQLAKASALSPGSVTGKKAAEALAQLH
ncbi:MAG: tetratricopeptide repeat protein, partial [Bryocella sp.]